MGFYFAVWAETPIDVMIEPRGFDREISGDLVVASRGNPIAKVALPAESDLRDLGEFVGEAFSQMAVRMPTRRLVVRVDHISAVAWIAL